MRSLMFYLREMDYTIRPETSYWYVNIYGANPIREFRRILDTHFVAVTYTQGRSYSRLSRETGKVVMVEQRSGTEVWAFFFLKEEWNYERTHIFSP